MNYSLFDMCDTVDLHTGNELLQSLEKVLCITTYEGCTIHQKENGFYVFGQKHDTLEQAHRTIVESLNTFQKSITKSKQ